MSRTGNREKIHNSAVFAFYFLLAPGIYLRKIKKKICLFGRVSETAFGAGYELFLEKQKKRQAFKLDKEELENDEIFHCVI